MSDPSIVVSHVSRSAAATHVRSTLLQSSIKLMRATGHFDRYLTLLPPEVRDDIVMTLAPTWLPIDLAIAHYRACDALGLDEEERARIAEAVGDWIQGTFLSTLVRGAQAVGITPWTLLSHFDRLWSRLFCGGSVQVTRVGPKDARIELGGIPELAQLGYFRTGISGVVRAGCKMGGTKTIYVKVAPTSARDAREGALVLLTAWV